MGSEMCIRDRLCRRHCTCQRLRWGARNGRSSPLGAARALEMAARTRSAPLGRSTWPLEPARFGSAWPRKHRTCRRLRHRARSASEIEPARLRLGARHRSSSPFGSVGPETLHWAGPRMPASLNRETNILVHGMHGHTLVYIYIYMFLYFLFDLSHNMDAILLFLTYVMASDSLLRPCLSKAGCKHTNN